MTKAEEISCSRDGGEKSVSSKLSLHRTKLDSMFGRSHPTGAFQMFQSAFIALTSWNDSCRYDWRKKCGQRGHAAALRGSSLDTNTAPPPSNKWRPAVARAAEAVRDRAISMLCLTAAAAARSMYIGDAAWAHRTGASLPSPVWQPRRSSHFSYPA